VCVYGYVCCLCVRPEIFFTGGMHRRRATFDRCQRCPAATNEPLWVNSLSSEYLSSTKSFVVLIIRNSKSNQLGAQGTFK